ncbi:hypothetical protein FHW36_103580 [Chitinophaga polysaccharea]|uniref:Uncharacterized protein n=1 Tax=Chitinophaga polysaccharea TaxID=1293035 RepID=A0A561PUI6_9BACT|nr:hypothetical protein [Chitinophaga polysaccharea]TWF41776.1 hypothetical protein FHW36_103580 [Chitinophaga polysaccharea]
MTELWKVQWDTAFVKHVESKSLLVGSLYENGYLFHLATKEVTYINWFYGNPTCAVISGDEQWAVMGGGEILTVWKNQATFDIALAWPYDMRQSGPGIVQVLTDPWVENAAVWELDITTLDVQKLRDFREYIGKAYMEQVAW